MKTVVVPASKLNPKKSLRARDYIGKGKPATKEVRKKTKKGILARDPAPEPIHLKLKNGSSDAYLVVSDAARGVHQLAKSKGWWKGKKNSLANKLLLLHSEITEAVEELRDGRPLTEVRFVVDKQGQVKPEGFPIEIADLLIRTLDLCERNRIDIGVAIKMKHTFNMGRPYLHGGKLF